MRRLVSLWLLLAISCCLLTGCWDQAIITSLVKVNGIGVDSGDLPGLLKISAQLTVPASTSGGNIQTSGELRVVSAQASTIWEGLRLMQGHLRRTPFLLQLEFIIIGESPARKGIDQIVAQLTGTTQIRNSVPVFVTAGKAEAALLAHSGLGRTAAQDIADLTREDAKIVINNRTDVNDLINTLGNLGKELALPTIDLEPLALESSTDLPNDGTGLGGERYQEVAITRTALFQRDAWVDTLDEIQTRMLILLLGKSRREYFSTSNPTNAANPMTYSLEHIKVSYRPEVTGQGPPQFKLKVIADCHVQDVAGGYDLKGMETAPLEQQIAAEMELRTAQLLNKLQAIGVDTLGLGEVISKRRPSAWKQLEPNWSTIYPQLQIAVQYQVTVRSTEMAQKFFQTKR